MMKLLVIAAVLTSPLLADLYTANYTFPTNYTNIISNTNGSTVAKIGTMQNDSKSFRVYGEATISMGSPVCFVVMFNAMSQHDWKNARGFYVNSYISSNHSVVNVRGLSASTYPFTDGGLTAFSSSGTTWFTFYRDTSDVNPSMMSVNNSDMYTYKWEVVSSYASGTFKGPDDFAANSIAYNLYNYSCSSSMDIEPGKEMAGGFTYDSLKVVRANYSLIAGLSMLLMTLGLLASL